MDNLDTIIITIGILLGGAVKIPKIEINLWGWLLKKAGKYLNGDLTDKVNRLQSDLTAHIKTSEKEKALDARRRFLRFDDDLCSGRNFGKEHFCQVLRDIDTYEQYCDDHPDFLNSQADLSIKHIKAVYSVKLEQDDFLR